MRALVLLALVLAGCGGTSVQPSGACTSGTSSHVFRFDAAGSDVVDVAELVRVTGAGRWSVHLALTMVSPVEFPAGDNVASFYTLTTPTIQQSEFLDNTNFEPVPLPDGAVQSVAELVVDVPADEVLVGARVQYNAHAAGAFAVRVDAEACR